MKYSYEIQDDYTANIWDNLEQEGPPTITQPLNPIGRPWVSAEEARDWAAGYADLLFGEVVVEPPHEPVEEEPVEEDPVEEDPVEEAAP